MGIRDRVRTMAGEGVIKLDVIRDTDVSPRHARGLTEMTGAGTTEAGDPSVPFAVEGEGPVTLVLLASQELNSDGLGVVAHYLAEEAPDEARTARYRAAVSLVWRIDRRGMKPSWIA